MWKYKLCLGTFRLKGDEKAQIEMFKKAGFEGFFVGYREQIDLKAIRDYADSIGMYFQSVHAPFHGAADMWRGGEKAEKALAELLECVKEASRAGVKIVVCHAWIGFDYEDVPNQTGLDNYKKVIDYAAEMGVNIAFENTEGEEFLNALLVAFGDYENVGFCLDTGHETCYNQSKDLLALYGNHLIATHINDNLGVKDFHGKIIWTDDLHLLPFDGVKDWENFAYRMNKCGYQGKLTFELNLTSKPDRHENDGYAEMPFERYLAEAYKRACRVATLIEREKNKGV